MKPDAARDEGKREENDSDEGTVVTGRRRRRREIELAEVGANTVEGLAVERDSGALVDALGELIF